VHLASSGKEVAGLALHTPLLSGVRVLSPNLRFWPNWLDCYPNHVLIPKISRPIMVLHVSGAKPLPCPSAGPAGDVRQLCWRARAQGAAAAPLSPPSSRAVPQPAARSTPRPSCCRPPRASRPQGTADEVIHFSHGKKAHELAQQPYPALWAEGYNHQNLETCPEYIPALNTFLDKLFGSDRW
jgi:hypothetical protein